MVHNISTFVDPGVGGPKGPRIESAGRAVQARRGRTKIWTVIIVAVTALAALILVVFLLNILNDVFGYVAVEYEVMPAEITGSPDTPIEDLEHTTVVQALRDRATTGILRRLESEEPLQTRNKASLIEALEQFVLRPRVVTSWSLLESIFGLRTVESHAAAFPNQSIQFRSWISLDFLVSPQSPVPEKSGIRGALIGTLWLVVIAMLVSLPIGIAAAIYLNEYTADTRLVRFIRVNVENLAAVPSIIYGMLGLAVFARALAPMTSGAAFGIETQGLRLGRTVLSGGLTLAVLVLPVVIINAREAFAAIPRSLREACYVVGARRFQVIRTRLLRFAGRRIMTTIILSVSRVIGETAPLVVIGAASFMTTDPNGLFSRFTALPTTVYALAGRPQAEYQRVAAATIIVLLLLTIVLNIVLIVLRNRLGQSPARRATKSTAGKKRGGSKRVGISSQNGVKSNG